MSSLNISVCPYFWAYTVLVKITDRDEFIKHILLIRMGHYFCFELHQNLWKTYNPTQKSVEDLCPPKILVQFWPQKTCKEKICIWWPLGWTYMSSSYIFTQILSMAQESSSANFLYADNYVCFFSLTSCQSSAKSNSNLSAPYLENLKSFSVARWLSKVPMVRVAHFGLEG